MKTTALDQLLVRLRDVARRGPIPSIRAGSTGVGMTLLEALGVDYSSTAKPQFMGIVVTARRDAPGTAATRVNLFARVPDWGRSACKSSGEIAERFGYLSDGKERKLYCTLRAGQPNSQGLFLRVDREAGVLEECAKVGSLVLSVVVWPLADLERRLRETHQESVWVTAKSVRHGTRELFHYRTATISPAPIEHRLAELLEAGTVTVDHLITTVDGRTREKGPLFKVSPSNIPLLFGKPRVIDLLEPE